MSARNIKSVSDLYTRRNYQAVTLLWRAIMACDVCRPHLLFALSSIAGVASRRNRWPQFAIISGTIYVPSISVEMNVWEQFARKYLALIESGSSRLGSKHGDGFFVRVGDATDFSAIPTNSIDYVFADPPFGSNFYYAEVNLLWEFLLCRTTDESRDAVVHRKNDGGYKGLDFYSVMMQGAMAEMYRVLKPGRWVTVEFNNSDGQVFEAIKSAVRDAGFSIENMLFLDKVQKTFKQLKGEKGEEDVVGHDVIFNLRKPAPVFAKVDLDHRLTEPEKSQVRSHIHQQLQTAGRTVSELIEHVVVETTREHLRTLPERIQADPKTYSDEHRTTPFLNTMLMNALIPKGINVEQLNLPFIESICVRYFRKVDNRWFLSDEVVGNNRPGREPGALFQPADEEVVIKDETAAIEWLRQRLSKTPMRIGELRPHWMRATVMLTGDLSTRLESFLSENFWLDRQTRRWREPTDDERTQMGNVERQRARDEADRFLAGTLRRHPSGDEILDWIGHLYDSASLIEDEAVGLSDTGQEGDLPPDAAKLYAMMPRLFQAVLKETVEAQRHALAQRQCRIASTKLAAQAEREKEREQVVEAATQEMPLFKNVSVDE